MINWIKALRLPVATLAILLAYVSFKISSVDVNSTALVALFFISCATMLQNDWRDRYHDIEKGKILAIKKSHLFFICLDTLWIISFLLILAATAENKALGIILALVALCGVLYSETRRVPFLPIFLVSITSASPTLLPIAIGADWHKIWPLSITAALIILGREITKDIEDAHIDVGYKWTIPVAFGREKAELAAVIAITAGLIVILAISFLALPALIFGLRGVFLIINRGSLRVSRGFLDLSMAFSMMLLSVYHDA